MFSQAFVILFTIGLMATRLSLLQCGRYVYYWDAFLFLPAETKFWPR